MSKTEIYDVFISYSRKDKKMVDMFVDRLTSEGFTVWIDKDGIESGDAFKHVIVNAIEQSKVVVFFSSDASNSSTWTSKEIGVAIYENKPIIPVRLDNAKYNSEIKFDLINLDYIDVRGGNPSEEVYGRLIRTLRHRCGKSEGSTVVTDPEKPEKPAKTDSIVLTWEKVGLVLLIIVSIMITATIGTLFWLAVLVSYFSKNHRQLWNWTWSHQRQIWIAGIAILAIFFIIGCLYEFFSASPAPTYYKYEDSVVVNSAVVEPTYQYEYWDYDTVAVDSVATPDDWAIAE